MCECEFCDHHKLLLTCKFDGIGITVKVVNHTQLDAMAKVKRNESVISVGQSNRIKYCPRRAELRIKEAAENRGKV